jgi:hypothetical protein
VNPLATTAPIDQNAAHFFNKAGEIITYEFSLSSTTALTEVDTVSSSAVHHPNATGNERLLDKFFPRDSTHVKQNGKSYGPRCYHVPGSK